MKLLLQRTSMCVTYSHNYYHPPGTFTEDELEEELCAEL